MGEPPKISVLMPCYRQERFVEEAVASLLAQGFGDWELVASDDASPDGTATVLKKLACGDSRIRFFRQPRNLGMVENWNFCLREARGEAVKMMGGDDVLRRPDCLSRQWRDLQKPGVALAACGRTLIDDGSRPWRTLAELPSGVFPSATVIPRMLRHQDNLIGEPVCCLFRRQDARRGFEVHRQQSTDVEMWFHLLEQGALSYEPEPLVSFRVHPSQKSAANLPGDRGWEQLQLILEKARLADVPPPVRSAVLFRAEEWLRKQPSHPGRGEILHGAFRLRDSISRGQRILARIRHALSRTCIRWEGSLRKRLPG